MATERYEVWERLGRFVAWVCLAAVGLLIFVPLTIGLIGKVLKWH